MSNLLIAFECPICGADGFRRVQGLQHHVPQPRAFHQTPRAAREEGDRLSAVLFFCNALRVAASQAFLFFLRAVSPQFVYTLSTARTQAGSASRPLFGMDILRAVRMPVDISICRVRAIVFRSGARCASLYHRAQFSVLITS